MRDGVPVLTIPGGDAARVRTLVARHTADRLALTLAVQAEAHGDTGILRDDAAPYAVRSIDGARRRVTDPAALRADFLPVAGAGDTHVSRFAAVRPGRVARRVVGCGNLLCNRGVRAKTSAGVFGAPGPMRRAVRVADGTRGELVDAHAIDADGRALAADDFVVAAPLIVADGAPAPIDADEWADLRHLLLPAYAEFLPGRRLDFGLEILARNPALRDRAVAGEPITLPLVVSVRTDDDADAAPREHAVDPDTLAAALAVKGYVATATPRRRGEFRLDGGRVTIAFLRGIYPHHALVVEADGGLASVIVTGRSNREGCAVDDLARAVADSGARAAIVVDDGGDVGLWERGGPHGEGEFVVRPAEADRARSWPLRACLIAHEPRP